jgi:hypothetical protein
MPNPNGSKPEPVVVPFTVNTQFVVMPVATGFEWQYDPAGGSFPVRLVVTTPVGCSVYCLDAETASKLGEGLATVAQQARTGLLIAKAEDLPRKDQP